MEDVNLLPKSSAERKRLSAVAGLLTKLATALSVLVLVLAASAIAATFILGNRRDEAFRQNTALIEQVKELEEEEQRLALTKNRLSMIKDLLAARLGEQAFALQRELLGALDGRGELTDLAVSEGSSNLGVAIPTSRLFRDFVSELENTSISAVALKSLIFDSGTGFKLNLNIF